MRKALILAVLMFSNFCWAQSLSGFVSIQGSDAPISGATIELKKGSIAEQEKADAAGHFRFLNLDPGEYELTASAPGYLTVKQRLSIAPRSALSLELSLASAQQGRSEITVTAPEDAVQLGNTTTSRLVTHTEVEALPEPARRNIQTLALTEVPGAMLSHDNFIHMRGNEMSLHEFINGVSFLDNSHEHFSPPLNPWNFEAMNFVLGGFDAEYGNRFGGIVDATTRSGLTNPGHGSVEAGIGSLPNGDGLFDYGNKIGDFGVYVFGSARGTTRFLNTPVPETFHDFGKAGTAGMQLDWKRSSNALRLYLEGGADGFQLPNTPELEAESRDARRRLRSQTGILNWEHFFSSTALLNVSGYERTISDHILPTPDPNTEFADATRATRSAGVKADASVFSGIHSIKFGADFTDLHLQESLVFDPRDPADPLGPFNFHGNRSGTLSSVYLQDRISLLRDFTLSVGARLDHYDLLEDTTQGSPRVGLAYYSPKTRTSVHVAYNRFFSPPPIEYSLLASYIGLNHPDPDKRVGILKPYLQSYYEAGLDQQITTGTTLRASAWKHRGKDVFENAEIGMSRLFTSTNFSHENSYGADLTLAFKQLQERGLIAQLNYAYAHTFFFSPFAGGISDEPLLPGERVLPAFDEVHTGSLLLLYQSKWHGFFGSSQVRYGSGTPILEGTARLPQHTISDLSAGFDAWKHERNTLRMEFVAENISDNRYGVAKESEDTPVQFVQGRVFSGRVRFSF